MEQHGSASQIERYEVETLWVKLGNYATQEGAIIKMDIVKGNTSETYNLRFTVNGSYISITDFISDVENDSTLGFKIEEFRMGPTTDEGVLEAKFTCKEVGIKDVSNKSNVNIITDDSTMGTMNENTTNTISQNTTNTTNTTNTNNTINSTNTKNNTNTTTSNTNVSR